MTPLEPPLGLLAELTHRCPLQCPYCSNPVELARATGELTPAEWGRVFREARELGVLQLHLSGGEPTLRQDLEQIVALARDADLYVNLITAGVTLDAERLARLKAEGLDHVQLSVQDSDPAGAERIGGYRGAHAKKLALAREIRAQGLPLTLNAVVHRQNLDRLEQTIELALELGAHRLEIANVQYYGWALLNRAALMPTREQVRAASELVERMKPELVGRLVIDYVVPDYYAREPKPCMGGWGRTMLAVTPQGDVMPCHAAASIKGMSFANVREHGLGWIWHESPAFQRFRGTAWMPEPCRSCPRKEVDFGGCRCQAMALAGDAAATDPACALSPHHALMQVVAEREAETGPVDFVYRRFRKEQVTPADRLLAPS